MRTVQIMAKKTQKVIEEDESGVMSFYDESPEERARRVQEWADEVARKLEMTPGQAETLATA